LPECVEYSTTFSYIRDGNAGTGLFSLRLAGFFCMQRARRMRIEAFGTLPVAAGRM
jgi:hypothetical protein